MSAAPRIEVLAILQARMTSTRLPGKVMRPILGAPMLARQIERLRRSRRIDRLVLATSDHASDDPLAALAASLDLDVHRGSLDDVLGRFQGAAETFGPAGHVLRLTGDCPLADPELIDELIVRYLASGADYASNTGEVRTFPKGLDAEIMRAPVLQTAAAEARSPYDREHVTPFIYARPDRFRLVFLERDTGPSEARWTVDTPEDLMFVESVYEALYPADPAFASADVSRFVRSRPDLWSVGGFPRL